MRGKVKQLITCMVIAISCLLICSVNTTYAASKTVAVIGKKQYTSLDKAVKAVKNGQTIKLVSSIRLKKWIPVNKNAKYTIDLNNHSILSPQIGGGQGWSFWISKGTVKVKGGYVESLVVENGANVRVESGTYDEILNRGICELSKCKVNEILTNYQDDEKNKLTVTKCTVKKLDGWNGTLTINSGKFSEPIRIRQGKCYIKGGSFFSLTIEPLAQCVISGGTFNNTNRFTGNCSIWSQGNLKITGGTVRNVLSCTIHTTTIITGGYFEEIGVGTGVKKFSMTGGTLAPRSDEDLKLYPAISVERTNNQIGGNVIIRPSKYIGTRKMYDYF